MNVQNKDLKYTALNVLYKHMCTHLYDGRVSEWKSGEWEWMGELRRLVYSVWCGKNSSVKVSVAAGGWGCMVWVRAGWHDVFPSVERRDEGGRFYHRAENVQLVYDHSLQDPELLFIYTIS